MFAKLVAWGVEHEIDGNLTDMLTAHAKANPRVRVYKPLCGRLVRVQ